jgi:hypothetical protein
MEEMGMSSYGASVSSVGKGGEEVSPFVLEGIRMSAKRSLRTF